MNTFELAATAPCGSSACASIALEVMAEIRALLPTFPAGEYRSSLTERLSEINAAVEGWEQSAPTADERKRVTAAALNLFAEAIDSEHAREVTGVGAIRVV